MIVKLYGHKIDLGDNPSALCVKRWQGKLSPEPETVAWLEGMTRGEVFFDIGANVGTFSVRAALHGMQVVSFEPVLEHYVELCGIIQRNQLSILAFNIALSHKPRVGSLGKGRSTHTLCVPQLGKPAVVAMTVDDMVALLGTTPAHVKIDVDGDEYAILTGMPETLFKVKSLLVEVDPQIREHNKIPQLLEGYGLVYDPEQVEACKVQTGKYAGMSNYIFERVG